MKMTRREKLQEAYEDALFALLMEDVIEEEGQRLAEKNEQLKRDPSAAVPGELNERCMKTIHRAYGQRRCKDTGKQVGRSFTKVFSRVAVVAVICMLLFSVAYAVSPEIRVATLNLLIEISDVNTILSVESSNESLKNYDDSAAAREVYERFGYRIPKMPSIFSLTEKSVYDTMAILKYESSDGAAIKFRFTRTTGGEFSVDTEDAQRSEDISVNGLDGLLLSKENWIRIVWSDPDKNTFVSVTGTAVSEDLLLEIVNATGFPSP